MASADELKASQEIITKFETEIKGYQAKIKELHGKTGTRIGLEFSTQPIEHTPEPEKIPPYPRILYRYKATSTQPPVMNAHVQMRTLDHSARFYRDVTDEAFRTNPDIIQAIKDSDLEIAWVEQTHKCHTCSQWTYFLKDCVLDVEWACAHCMQTKLDNLAKLIAGCEQKIAVERNKHLVAFAVQSLGLSEKSVVTYLDKRGDDGKAYLAKAELLDIKRETLNLTALAQVKTWKLSTVLSKDYPTAAVEFLTKVGIVEADWILGSIQDKVKYAEMRKIWLETLQIKLPLSPRIRGVLQVFGASEEVLKHFEERLVVKRESSSASAAEMVKQKKDSANQIYLSNHPDPLFNIGTWGNGHYASCQNFIGGGWGPGYCKTLATLLDPTIRVVWYGKPTEMLARQLVRERIHPDSKKKIWICDAHYGAETHRASLQKALAVHAATLGIEVYNMQGSSPKSAATEHDVDFRKIGPSYFDGGNAMTKTTGTSYQLRTTFGTKISV